MRSFHNGSFDPRTLVVLETAFDEAWLTLKSVGNKTVKPDELARYVLRMAMEGERDPVRLHDRALDRLLPATIWREASCGEYGDQRLHQAFVGCQSRQRQYRRRGSPFVNNATISNRITAPIVATTIALTTPLPMWTPSWGRSHVPIKAPTIPIATSAMRPNPAPLTSCPASQPATRPTSNMMSRT